VNGTVDHRLAVRFGPPASDEAVLVEEGQSAPFGHTVVWFRLAPPARLGHPMHCLCCVPRGPVAEALGRLFLSRARNEVPWFRAVAVIASARGQGAVRAALAEDQVSAGRFRLACS